MLHFRRHKRYLNIGHDNKKEMPILHYHYLHKENFKSTS